MANVEINHNAVRLLWEGLNAYPNFPNAIVPRQQRRVLYMPFMDGHVNLHITDAAGKFVSLMQPQDLIDYILPKKFIPLLPKEIQTFIYDPEADER